MFRPTPLHSLQRPFVLTAIDSPTHGSAPWRPTPQYGRHQISTRGWACFCPFRAPGAHLVPFIDEPGWQLRVWRKGTQHPTSLYSVFLSPWGRLVRSSAFCQKPSCPVYKGTSSPPFPPTEHCGTIATLMSPSFLYLANKFTDTSRDLISSFQHGPVELRGQPTGRFHQYCVCSAVDHDRSCLKDHILARCADVGWPELHREVGPLHRAADRLRQVL